VRETNVWYLFAVDATGKKIRGQADGKVNDYDQYGKLTFALISIKLWYMLSVGSVQSVS
jgi:hypothetical protein